MLIKPKRIEITSHVGGEETKVAYNIGRYDGFYGLELVEYATDILKSGLNILKNTKKGLMCECLEKMGKFIEAVVTDDHGEERLILLDNRTLLSAYMPDVEVSMKLMMEVHDYNTFFLNSANLLKQSVGWMGRVEELIVETLERSLHSSSQVDTQH